MRSILIPLPSFGFDPSEVAIPWQQLTEQGHQVVFATPNGQPATADPLMLHGQRLGLWRPLLRARNDAVKAYGAMEQSEAFQHPRGYVSLQMADYDALLLPGGHDKGVREYLESVVLQQCVADFFAAQKPVAAVCHGVVLAARSKIDGCGRSVLHGYRTTALLKSQEMLAYHLTRWWLQDYYLTYPGLTVEEEVRGVLARPDDFVTGPKTIHRDTPAKLSRGFFVRDRNYLSARWPGDLYAFSSQLLNMLQELEAP